MAERGGLVKLPGGQTGDSKVRGERSNQGQGGGSGSGCAEGGPWGGGPLRPGQLPWAGLDLSPPATPGAQSTCPSQASQSGAAFLEPPLSLQLL